jgi:hypothetical protein
MQTSGPSEAGRDRRADMRKSSAVKLMKIGAPKAALEPAAGNTGRNGRGAAAQTGGGDGDA